MPILNIDYMTILELVVFSTFISLIPWEKRQNCLLAEITFAVCIKGVDPALLFRHFAVYRFCGLLVFHIVSTLMYYPEFLFEKHSW